MGFDQAAHIGWQAYKAQIYPKSVWLSWESYDVYDKRSK